MKHCKETQHFKVAALYKFVALPDYTNLQPSILNFCQQHNIRGTLLLAHEGINGTVAGSPDDIDALIAYLQTANIFKNRLGDIDVKYSYTDAPPFLRMKVRLKREIVTLRAEEANPTKQVGTYVSAEQWNDLIDDPDLVILDTRNDYEVALGTFEGAIDPKTENFTQFKDFVAQTLDPDTTKKVAMFCTGGIRCEKASAYMLAQGFEEVFHLKGGILNYLETIRQENSKWQGDCFVFDERVAVNHNLKPSGHTQCHACRMPLNEAMRHSPDFIEGVQCPHCRDSKSPSERDRARARQHQMTLAKARGLAHLGDDAIGDAAAMKQQKKLVKEKSRGDAG
jgi:UPF0176 protein